MKNLLLSLIPLILIIYSCDSRSNQQKKDIDLTFDSEAVLKEGKQLSEKILWQLSSIS